MLARSLGWPLVPPTLVRDGPRGVGSVQLFVSFDPGQHFFTLEVERAEEFRRVALFDVVANNADRKGGHVLAGAAERVYGVDHGVCFHVQNKLRTVLWGWAGEPLTDAVGEPLRRLAVALTGELAGELAAHLSAAEITALGTRVNDLLTSGRFPAPGGHRPAVPWPPI